MGSDNSLLLSHLNCGRANLPGHTHNICTIFFSRLPLRHTHSPPSIVKSATEEYGEEAEEKAKMKVFGTRLTEENLNVSR